MQCGCPHRKECGFFSRFGHRTSRTWKHLVEVYCLGKMGSLCRRRIDCGKDGPGFADDIMPTGEKVPEVFHLLP